MNFSRTFNRKASDDLATGGNSSIQENGLQASTMAREFVRTPLGSLGSSGPLQAGIADEFDIFNRVAPGAHSPQYLEHIDRIDILVDHHRPFGRVALSDLYEGHHIHCIS